MNYFGAGVLPFYINKNDEVCLLLLRETRIDSLTKEVQKNAYIDLGGKREYYDKDEAYTAIREMKEESNNMYLDKSEELLEQIRTKKHPSFILPGKKYYWFFCIKVEYREPPNKKLEWVRLKDIFEALDEKSDVLNGSPIANRLLQILNLPGVRERLACL